MSTTTQILFNSPALHSLKRDQLVKLCKIHAIKASGKNVDLIDRLKNHAATLPRDTPLSVAMRSEGVEDGEDDPGKQASALLADHPRPSEQWDVVMESIQEVEESSSQGTLSSLRTMGSNNTGEFGTGSSKATSVSSSLKAFATSLGLKRSKSKPTLPSTSELPSNSRTTPPDHPVDELTKNAIPYSSIPQTDPSALPTTDHFTLATQSASVGPYTDLEPIPGHALRPGVPAPSNARLSIGTTATPGATTTIRLVSASYVPKPDHPSTPKLRPFTTSFDLVVGTPSAGARMDVWPKEDRSTGIYPAIPASPFAPAKTESDNDVNMPGGMACPSPAVQFVPEQDVSAVRPHTPSPSRQNLLAAPAPAPFIFGSPLPQHRLSNQQFRDAAASVLEEMNKRLANDGVETLTLDLLNHPKRGDGNADKVNSGTSSGTAVSTGGERFERVHEREFSKMDSIASHYAARREDGVGRGKKRKSSLVLGKKNRPSGTRVGATRVISGGRRKLAVPGAFGDEDGDEEGEEDRRLSKKPRINDNDAGQQASSEPGKGKRVSIAPIAMGNDEDDQQEEKKRLKEKEAIRRKLDKNKARRRSSMGRVSIGGGKIPPPKKGIASRFGFLSSAKSMVQSVWNRGTTSTSAKPAASAPVSGIPQSSKRPAKAPAAMAPPPPKVAAPVATRTSSVGGKGPSLIGRVTSSSGRLLKPGGTNTVTSTSTAAFSRSRSPIPSSFTRPPSTVGSTRSGTGSKAGSVTGTVGSRTGLGSRVGSRNGSIAASSVGTRSSIATRSRVSSLGTRGSLASVASGAAGDPETTKREVGKTGTGLKRMLSSRILAPTASSLARAPGGRAAGNTSGPAAGRSGIAQNKELPSGLEAVAEDQNVTTLGSITNKPAALGRQPLRRGGKIFSKPLVSPPVSAAAGTASLAGAGAMLSPGKMDVDVEAGTQASAPKLESTATGGGGVTNSNNLTGNRPMGLKPKMLPGRKPRISRSRVIARLATQRAASGSGMGGGAGRDDGGASVTGRVRSSLGTAKRRSFAGGKGARGSDVLMSAKKRARQSEYARRKSRVLSAAGAAMDIEN